MTPGQAQKAAAGLLLALVLVAGVMAVRWLLVSAAPPAAPRAPSPRQVENFIAGCIAVVREAEAGHG